MLSSFRCAVVTGGNKGIGHERCRQLASNGILVILTARDKKKGISAVENLKESGLSDVLFHQLDVKGPIRVLFHWQTSLKPDLENWTSW
ncbi:hypothetical protein GIB67_014525 [Kingdonia uniflora]|uniref:Uncharacterized protein n=2 Tax=Kingdonia uniflora TaxID=39325 RepID=A0A7J7NQQ6_9MAGN|nr:hypothetical protein GIB67_014525 [Kingdonia uniflora]